VLIYTVTDRLVGAGFAELNQVLLALVLIAATLFLRAGIIARLLERPGPPTLVFAVVLAGQLIIGGPAVITQVAIAMIAALLVLFLPDRLYELLDPRRRRGDDGGDRPTSDAGTPAERVAATDVEGGDHGRGA
jgi:hypothetical protein